MKTLLLAVVFTLTFHSTLHGGVHPHRGNYSGGGFLVGTPIKASLRGFLIQTFELEITLGAFQDSNRYLGQAMSISTEDPSVFNQFRALDPDKTYVFEYVFPSRVRFKFTDTHFLITAIHPIGESKPLRTIGSLAALREVSNLGNHRVGWVSHGTRKGRVIQVDRWQGITGIFDPVCLISMTMGGLRVTGRSDGSRTEDNIAGFVAHSEEACQFAERALFLGEDMEAEYSEDAVELWEGERRVLTKMKYLENVPAQNFTSNKPSKPTGAELENLKEELLKDPEFLRQVREKLNAN